MPAAHSAPCNAAVPLENAIACFASVTQHSASSKRATVGPDVSHDPRNTSTTAATSSSPIVCFPYGITPRRAPASSTSVSRSGDRGGRHDVAQQRAQLLDAEPLVVRVAGVDELAVDGRAEQLRALLV